MGCNIFVSYKYSDATDFKNEICSFIKNKTNDNYFGETDESKDISDCCESTVKSYLADKMFYTTVTIVIMSPDMNKSEYIEWEVLYSLKNESRDGRQSHPNAIIGVVMPVNGRWDWFFNRYDGENISYHLMNIIKLNRNNKLDDISYKKLSKNYIDVYTHIEFYMRYDDIIKEAIFKKDNINCYNIIRKL